MDKAYHIRIRSIPRLVPDIVERERDGGTFFWSLAVFSFLFYCYFPRLSSLIVPCLGMYLILQFSSIQWDYFKSRSLIFFLYTVCLLCSAVYSAAGGTGITRIIRFFLILEIIPFAQMMQKKDFRLEWNIFQILIFLKAVSITVIWLIAFVTQDFTKLREWISAKGTGDIYILDHIPRVQLQGNSLFVMALICEWCRKRRITWFGAGMLMAVLVSGNRAYVLGIAAFAGLSLFSLLVRWFRERDWRRWILLGLILVLAAAFAVFALQVFQSKAEYSNAIRRYQFRMLTDTNPLFGSGLGNYIQGSDAYRSYDGDMYFELQTVYIYNQIGAIVLCMYYALTILPYVGKNHRRQLFAYLSYIAYTFWNPYCFDSTQIITMILITNLLYEPALKKLPVPQSRYVYVRFSAGKAVSRP